HRNSLFAAFVAAQYMDQSGEGIDPPYGALSDLVRKVRDTRLSVYAVAEALRSWRI
ncbi:toxin Doc, partial [Streptomyces sp. NPDC048304]